MPIEEIDKKRPICDTDIWIKSCKYKEIYNKELIFKIYEKIYMPDAVRQEIGRERNDNFEEDFLLALKYFQDENKNRLDVIRSFDDKFFNKEEKIALEREFLNKNIIYDMKEMKYKGMKSGLGEKVVLSFAAVLEMPIILSDDHHCKEEVEEVLVHYPYLKVINLYTLLKTIYKDNDKIIEIRNCVNKPLKEQSYIKSEAAISIDEDTKPNFKSFKKNIKVKLKNKYV